LYYTTRRFYVKSGYEKWRKKKRRAVSMFRSNKTVNREKLESPFFILKIFIG